MPVPPPPPPPPLALIVTSPPLVCKVTLVPATIEVTIPVRDEPSPENDDAVMIPVVLILPSVPIPPPAPPAEYPEICDVVIPVNPDPSP
jgi:hypothetical protein